jgi:hypothetical protein
MLSLQKSQSLSDLRCYRNGDLAAGRTFSSPFIPLQYFPALFSFNYASPDKPSFFSYLPSTFNSSRVSHPAWSALVDPANTRKRFVLLNAMSMTPTSLIARPTW